MASWNKGQGATIRFLRDLTAHEGSECVFWPFSRTKGYGTFGHLGKPHYAHRYLCELIYGSAPSPKHHAAHSCGNGHNGCVNPHHISWKTPAENMQDKRTHGTTKPHGAPRYKLTPERVAEIRALEGVTIAKMAECFGVSESSIRKIRSGQNWPTGQYPIVGFAKKPYRGGSKKKAAFSATER